MCNRNDAESEGTRVGKHLIVKLGAIGDVVMALPAVKHFKASVGGEIHWMCGRAAAPLVRLFPFVDRVIEVDDRSLFASSILGRTRELIRIWRLTAGSRYDTCAVLQYDWRYTLLTLFLRAQRRISLSRTDRSRKLIPGRYHGDEYARVLSGSDGFLATRLPPLCTPSNLTPSSLPRTFKTRIALVPGGARNALQQDPQRRWPISHYVELALALLARKYEVILVGGRDDFWVSSAFFGLGTTDLIGRMELTEVLSAFETCDLVISHDTGPLHLAALSSAAVLALFGPVNPQERIPNRPRMRYIWGGETLACRPCYDGHGFPACLNNRCMTEISPRAVLNVAEELLSQCRSTQKLQLTLV